MNYKLPKNFTVTCPTCLARITFCTNELNTIEEGDSNAMFDYGTKYLICPNPTCRHIVHIHDNDIFSEVTVNYD